MDSTSPMQTDEPDHANPSESMVASPTFPSEQARFKTLNIPDESIKSMYDTLKAFVRPDYDDATIRRHLRNIHYLIYHTLSDDLEVIERVADRDEVKANVEREGEDNVIELLRDTAKRESWLNLFESRTSVIYHSSDIKQRSDLSALGYIFQDHPGRH